MREISEKNRASWNAYAGDYGRYEQSGEKLSRIAQDPASAFDPATWRMIGAALPSLRGLDVCVPSSGDNHAAFALALLGARVTSCDISERQLENAERAAGRLGLSMAFHRADTQTLEGVADRAFDFIYTSNGVHVWIADLPAMYRSIARVLKPGGYYALYEIHPFQRPFDGGSDPEIRVVKPYDAVGPFDRGQEVTFGWRMQDILNALLDAGLCLRHLEELQPRVDYEQPDWVPHEDIVRAQGHAFAKEEIDRMYDWRVNPMAALPNLFTALARRGEL